MGEPEDVNQQKVVSLGLTGADYVTVAVRGVLGAIPFAGSLLAEIAGAIIPNQRVDRLAKFAAQLELRLSGLEQDFVRDQLTDENFTDLIEEAMRQAARSLSDERRAYIAALIANGMDADAVDFVESKHLLRILGELNDIEIIWLRSHLSLLTPDHYEFHTRHEAVLTPIPVYMGSPDSDVDKAALQQSYEEHLANLGLLEREYEMESSHSKTRLKVRGYNLTTLGRLLLRTIGLATAEDL